LTQELSCFLDIVLDVELSYHYAVISIIHPTSGASPAPRRAAERSQVQARVGRELHLREIRPLVVHNLSKSSSCSVLRIGMVRGWLICLPKIEPSTF